MCIKVDAHVHVYLGSCIQLQDPCLPDNHTYIYQCYIYLSVCCEKALRHRLIGPETINTSGYTSGTRAQDHTQGIMNIYLLLYTCIYVLPIAHCLLLPVAYFPLPTACCLLPIAYCLLPIENAA